MATTKVSALTALTTTDGAEELLINDGGTSKKVTIANLLHDNSIDSDHYVDGSIDLAHMSSESVDEDNLHISNAGSNGQFLSKQSGDAGGLTWATPTDTNTMGSGFTVSATTDSNATTITQGDDLMIAAGTGITTETTADGTVTITNTVSGASTATSSATGVVKIEDDTDQSVAANAVSATAGRTYGVQLNSSDQAVVNVPWTDTDTVYTLPEASASTKGGIELFSDTDQSVAAESVSTTANRTYGLQLNSDGQGVVNVPWTDTDTNTMGSGFTVSATTDSNATTITQGDDLMFTAGTGITCETTADGTVTISSTVTDTNTMGSGFTVSATTDTNATTITQGDDLMFTAGSGITQETTADGTVTTTLDLTSDQSWSGSQRGTPSVVTDGTLDLNTANNFKYTPGGADTLEFSNETAGQSGFITVINASGHAISLGSEVKKGSSWDVSTAGTYIVTYYCDGTSVYVSASEALS